MWFQQLQGYVTKSQANWRDSTILQHKTQCCNRGIQCLQMYHLQFYSQLGQQCWWFLIICVKYLEVWPQSSTCLSQQHIFHTAQVRLKFAEVNKTLRVCLQHLSTHRRVTQRQRPNNRQLNLRIILHFFVSFFFNYGIYNYKKNIITEDFFQTLANAGQVYGWTKMAQSSNPGFLYYMPHVYVTKQHLAWAWLKTKKQSKNLQQSFMAGLFS